MLWTLKGHYQPAPFADEASVEAAILQVKGELFGAGRLYLPVKKRIGNHSFKNIPDGYLLDLSSKLPRLYVVEVELDKHDPLRHVAVQLLQFSLSFESDGGTVKKVLYAALKQEPAALEMCNQYIDRHDFRNIDHLLEHLVESQFSALVIIDEASEVLQNALSKKFQFPVEVLEIDRLVGPDSNFAYLFEPFLADVAADVPPVGKGKKQVTIDDIDTIVVPARADGFQDVFLKEDRWYQIRIHGSMRPQIKYIAAYQVAPTSAITHVAPVKSIEPWKDTGKLVVNFSEPARVIGPIPSKGGRGTAPQAPRYTSYHLLLKAKSLDDLWGPSASVAEQGQK